MGLIDLNRLLSKRVKGGALYISVIISLVLGIILSLFILLSRYTQRTILKSESDSQLYLNIKSGFEISQSDYFSFSQNDRWLKNAFNDDSIKIKKLIWGAYNVICVQTKNRHNSISHSGIFGVSLPSDTALLVADYGRAIAASGNVSFGSTAYLPKGDIKPAYIEGQSYSGSAIKQNIRSSPPAIPQVISSFRDWLTNARAFNAFTDSMGLFQDKEIQNSFAKKTLIIETSSGLLTNRRLRDNIKVICNGELRIDSTCIIDNILIVAKKVIFEKGFKGSVHVIASDSIICNDRSNFQFPSSFVLDAATESNSMNTILFNKNVKFYGGIVALSNQKESKTFVKLNSTSEINGLIYASNYLHAEGRVNGTVVADKLLLKTPSAVYENHILSCEIDPKKMSGLIAVPLLFKEKTRLICCKSIS